MNQMKQWLAYSICALMPLLAAGCSSSSKNPGETPAKADPQNPPPTPEEVRVALKKNLDALYFDEHHKKDLHVEKVAYAFEDLKVGGPVLKSFGSGEPVRTVFPVKVKVEVESFVKDGKPAKYDRGGDAEPFYFSKDSKGEWQILNP
ncbi:MAG: hypothetical protein HY291_08020 [Planctomycetes bacterium]|nr:hypothetical protein [Planctomycetota bacterium]